MITDKTRGGDTKGLSSELYRRPGVEHLENAPESQSDPDGEGGLQGGSDNRLPAEGRAIL